MPARYDTSGPGAQGESGVTTGPTVLERCEPDGRVRLLSADTGPTMPPTTTTTDLTEYPPARRRRSPFELSATQLVATALAAVTATVAASYLGVAGTVIGAAVASVVSAIGNAVYTHSLHRTRDRVRARGPVGRSLPAPVAARSSVPPTLRAPERRPRPARGPSPWRVVALGSVAVFATVLAFVTGIEVV